ncbi:MULTISPECIES: hypothetical protein [unclassified Caballeronia]|uniref:hypothetical protein n=1 Tax=unclassified Caballeronia TaxID=2646786 RepID=UPI0028668577|nr:MULTISPECIES: hypothetical protein [unclassified Caballeronia]MDR5771090.1 hypothetical protein [Caballeronia sp. LZ002]MDR5846527.1 hypothetical protein [Caballeronia sp. LZ003]
MKERPLAFSAPMVHAILDGRKTQTRRVVKLPHANSLGQWEPTTIGGRNGGCTKDGQAIPEQGAIWHTRTADTLVCPYGQPGDRLWVRETWAQPAALDPGPTVYRADYPACVPSGFENVPLDDEITWKPSIHMPRALSRITLEITGVRVERLQAVSRGDAMDEGCPFPNIADGDDPRKWFFELWSQINGDESWDANPFVWVIEFRRIQL